jgi:uncharacterized membrane protein
MFEREKCDSTVKRNVATIIDLQSEVNRHRTAGQRIADDFAAVVGSWTFIIVQSMLLAIWILLNVGMLAYAWDPYPFILLNLALSFQAAYATPIIMMSQNRAARIADRRNHLDLQVNLLAEQESTQTLRLLSRLCQHLKIDVSDIDTCAELERDVEPNELANELDVAERKAEAQTNKKPR